MHHCVASRILLFPRIMANVYLGLGTNLGDRKKNITNATIIIGSVMGEIRQLSSLYTSEPWGFQSENNFLNAVVLIETEHSPETCLQMAKSIEREMGRTYHKTGEYEDRIIDIDILLYDNLIIDSESLKIPHPLIQERLFVLNPLAELAPEFVHPVLGKSIQELRDKLLELNS